MNLTDIERMEKKAKQFGLISRGGVNIQVWELTELLKLARLGLSAEFYKERCKALQSIQSTMRDPERKMVCDILANGYAAKYPNTEGGE